MRERLSHETPPPSRTNGGGVLLWTLGATGPTGPQADRRVQLGEAVEPPIAQPTDEPAFDDQHASFDLGFVTRPAWPGRQHSGAVVRRHLGIGSVDLRLVQAGLDDGDLGVVGNNETWHPADGCKGARVGPIQRLDMTALN